MPGNRNREIILEVAFGVLIFSSLGQVCPFATTGYSTTESYVSTSSGSECLPNLNNMAVYEGDENIIMNLTADPNNVKWTFKSTSDEMDTFTISNFGGYRDPSLTGLLYLNQSGLVILKATTTDYGNPTSTSGLYIAQCPNNIRTGVKLLVVRSGPKCSCAQINSTASNVSCNFIFADSTFHPIYPIVTWTVNGAYLATYVLNRTRIDPYVFLSQSTITIDTASSDIYECEMSFAEPIDIQFPYIATNAPEFSDSCSIEACRLTTEIGETTSVVPSATAPEIPITMEPSFGPIAGGTHLTIIMGSETIEYISRYVGSNIWGVRHVYFGEHLSSTLVLLQPSGSSTYEFVAVTPNATNSSTGQPLPIIIEFSTITSYMGPFNMTFNRKFTYMPNPEITGIYPNIFITSGGTLLDVFGQSLSSVAKPIIQLTLIVTRSAEDGSIPNVTTTITSRVCTVPPGNETYMQCPMPPLNLPDDFLEIINSLYNITVTRRRRSRDPINHLIANSHSLLSRFKRDLNVLTVNGSNGRDQAEIFLGFILDGYREYENFNDAFPDTRITFYSAPEINSSDELIQFDPSEDELIYVKGRYMSRGCRLIDYVVHIGNEICTNNDLQANQLSCRPPKVEPSSTLNDTRYCDGSGLSITINVGYKQYQYACLTYEDRSRRIGLIVGLTVGLGVFAILLIVLIACIIRSRRKKVSKENDIRQHSGEQELEYRDDKNAEQPDSQQSSNVIRTRQNAKTLYKPDDDYEKALQLESRQDYDRQIEDDDIQPNDEYSNFYGVDRN